MIEDAPQESIRKAPPDHLLPRPNIASPMSEDFPTPRANPAYVPMGPIPGSPSSSDTQSDQQSMWSKRSSGSEFDDMYDVTESESEGDVPIKLSSSIKKQMATRHKRPSLIIPSPSEWPSIDKLKSGVTPISPPIKLDVPHSAMFKLQNNNKLRVPSTSSTPSLDGNSSEEDGGGLSSCPSTPDLGRKDDDGDLWDAPVQLDPSSISLLQRMSGETEPEHLETVIEVPEERTMEMQEVVESPPVAANVRLKTNDLDPQSPDEGDDELSALSVPSPGGFFASLNSSVARHTWNPKDPAPATSVATEFYGLPFRRESVPPLPSNAQAVIDQAVNDHSTNGLATATATKFYGVPWREKTDRPIDLSILIDPSTLQTDPVTAKKITFSPTDVVTEVDEMDETYQDVLKESASANIDRTKLWLNAQTDYMKAICEDPDVTDSFKDLEDATPKTPEDQVSPQLTNTTSPSKKSVRFADSPIEGPNPGAEAIPKRISPIHDGTFWAGWQHQKRSQRARDVFQHRQARAEAEHVRRSSCSKQHVEQLQGRFEITATERPAPARPVSKFLPQAEEDEKKEIIAQAERERQALEQMSASSWHISAQKELQGGKLITSPIVETFRGRRDVEILDLSGQVHCSWAWNVAIEHPDAEIHTTVSSDAEAHVAESRLEGPNNHHVVAAPKPWELPFDDQTFDVISARNLYAQLKTTWPKGQAADEWDLTLRECLRCLKPGGYLEFNLMDAELLHPDDICQALGVEFAFNLKTRGYDPSSGKSFLPRLKRAGFQSIKRAWMVLPVADVQQRWVDTGKTLGAEHTAERVIGPDGTVEYYEAPVTGSTKDVRAMTGLVGARMWEQWILKLNGEMGRSEERCMEGVAKALEEGGKGSAGWRCLVGWARKGG